MTGLMREAQSAGILSHPGIVTIYDVGRTGRREYISRWSTSTVRHWSGWYWSRSSGRTAGLDLLAQTAAALDYAHKRGIVHRDIKPANMMLHERTLLRSLTSVSRASSLTR